MTNTYNTLNPLGSTSPKDLFDNASNFDEAMNSLSPSFYDRFSKRRETWAGMEKMVSDFLEAMGFEATHLVYVDGVPLQVDRPTQLIDRAPSVYKVEAPATFPVNLTGTWATDQLLLVDVGDAALRTSLAAGNGSTLVGWDRSATPVTDDTVSSALAATAVSVLEFSSFVVTKPNPTDPLTWDWSPAVQAAVDYCHTFVPAKSLSVPVMCRLASKVNIDRTVDGADFKANFTIFGVNGGGFFVDSAIPMFSSTIVPAIDLGDEVPVTQTVVLRDLNLDCTNPALAAYVLDGNKFLRTWVLGCSITRIKLALTNSYFQSLHFANNNIRLWAGTFLQSNGGAFDTRFNPGNMIEHGQNFLQLIASVNARAVVGCGVSGCLIEGLSGSGIVYSHVQGFHVTNNYFEGNAGPDIVADSFLATPNRGVTHSGNLHYPTPANAAEPSFWSVRWGSTIGGSSVGNFGGTRLNFTQPETQATFADYSLADAVSSSPYKLITQDVAYAIQSPAVNNSVHGNRAWDVGSICFNKDHLTKGFAGWICVVAGTPGQWRPFGVTMDTTGWRFTDENGSPFGEIHTTAPTGQQTALTLLYSNGTTVQLGRVTVGAADSGGTGFRALVVPN
jgi:hypothetical protein